MTQISQLPTTTGLPTASDAIPYAKAGQGASYSMTLAQVLAYFTANFASPDFTVETAAPTLSGFTATIVSTATNVWLILSPTGTMAAGTVVFPAAANAFDGQTVLISTQQQITALTVTSAGATFVGAPTTMGAGASVMFRFNLALLKWFAVNSSGGAVNVFDDIQINGDILDVNGEIMVELVEDYVPPTQPNYVRIENGNAAISAQGPNANADLGISAKGAGSVNIAVTTGEVTVDSGGGGIALTSVTGTISLDAQGGADIAMGAAGNINIDAAGTLALLSTGVMSIVGGVGSSLSVMTYVRFTPRTAAQLVALSTSLGNPAGIRAVCSDSNAAITAGIGAVLAGGGANVVPAFFDGTNWRIC